MLRTTLFAASLVCLAITAPLAGAIDQVVNDSQGRPINFDVQAAGVDVNGYASILDGIIHGDEISTVKVRIIPENRIGVECGSQAAACYQWTRGGRATIIVPSLAPNEVTSALVHEYGHHVDNSYEHLPNAPTLDGTPRWWATRNMAQLLANNQVAWNYQLGWDRSIAEIFAEDYKILNAPQTVHMIRSLGRPDQTVLDAIRTDLGPGAPPPSTTPPNSGQTLPPQSGVQPGSAQPGTPRARSRFNETGKIGARQRKSIPFPIASPRNVAVTIRATSRKPLKAVLRCNAKTAATKKVRRGTPVTLVAKQVTAGQCTVRLTAGAAAADYAMTVKKVRA